MSSLTDLPIDAYIRRIVQIIALGAVSYGMPTALTALFLENRFVQTAYTQSAFGIDEPYSVFEVQLGFFPVAFFEALVPSTVLGIGLWLFPTLAIKHLLYGRSQARLTFVTFSVVIAIIASLFNLDGYAGIGTLWDGVRSLLLCIGAVVAGLYLAKNTVLTEKI